MSTLSAVQPEDVTDWSDFERKVAIDLQHQGTWLFRGSRDDFALETSIERAANDWGIALNRLPDIELRLLRDFQRRFPAQQMLPIPRRSDTLAWLALMQHYRAPTRLLDWTYSPFVAAYFALEDLLRTRDPQRVAVVWAVNQQLFDRSRIDKLLNDDTRRKAYHRLDSRADGRSYRRLFMEDPCPVRFVAALNPFTLNVRLSIQQGVFLCPGDVAQPFETNLAALLDQTPNLQLRKFSIARRGVQVAIDRLYRMNITQSTLFPGIDGFSQHFRYRLPALAELPMTASGDVGDSTTE